MVLKREKIAIAGRAIFISPLVFASAFVRAFSDTVRPHSNLERRSSSRSRANTSRLENAVREIVEFEEERRRKGAIRWTIPAKSEECRNESHRKRESLERRGGRGRAGEKERGSARQSALERTRIIWKGHLGIPIRHSRLTRRSNSNQPPLNPTPARRVLYS